MQRTHIRPVAGDRSTSSDTDQSDPDQYDPVSPLRPRSTTRPDGGTRSGESSLTRTGSGIQGAILALCRRPIRSRGSVR